MPDLALAHDIHRRLSRRNRGRVRGALAISSRGDQVRTRSASSLTRLEPDTPATRLDGHLPEEVKPERRDRADGCPAGCGLRLEPAQVGREMDVIVDGPDPEVPNHILARGHADAPEIDGLVRVKGKNLRAGDMVQRQGDGGRRLRPGGAGDWWNAVRIKARNKSSFPDPDPDCGVPDARIPRIGSVGHYGS